jgi:hypothetical protein
MFKPEWRAVLLTHDVYAAVLPIERVAPQSWTDNETAPKVRVSTTCGGFGWCPESDSKGVTVRGREYAFEFVAKYTPDQGWSEDLVMHRSTCFRREGEKWVDCSTPASVQALHRQVMDQLARDTKTITAVSRGLALEKELAQHYTRIAELQDELAGRLQALARTYAERDNLIREMNEG